MQPWIRLIATSLGIMYTCCIRLHIKYHYNDRIQYCTIQLNSFMNLFNILIWWPIMINGNFSWLHRVVRKLVLLFRLWIHFVSSKGMRCVWMNTKHLLTIATIISADVVLVCVFFVTKISLFCAAYFLDECSFQTQAITYFGVCSNNMGNQNTIWPKQIELAKIDVVSPFFSIVSTSWV